MCKSAFRKSARTANNVPSISKLFLRVSGVVSDDNTKLQVSASHHSVGPKPLQHCHQVVQLRIITDCMDVLYCVDVLYSIILGFHSKLL